MAWLVDMTPARNAVLKASIVVLAAAFSAACAAPGEKPFRAKVVPVDEAPEDALGDWNAKDPIERLLLPTTSELA